MKFQDIHAKLISRFGERITGVNAENIDPWVEVAATAILEVSEYLKSDPGLQFDSLNNLSATDWFDADPKKQVKLGEPRIEVVYHLYSFTLRHSLVVKVKLPRWQGGVAGELPELQTVSAVWAVADWHEREAFDLVGINFLGHPDLRRILCSEDWVGHPLRRDYEFPLEYHGIRAQ